MGNSFANAFAEKQRALQLEMQDRMAVTQKKSQIAMQERMKRMQIATQVAVARERFWWFAGFHAFITTGMTIKRKHVHPAAVIPYLAFTLVTLYQWDFAYGNKLERIDKIFNKLQDEEHWYTPVDQETK
ncbi:hypothetical protein C9374_004433 [Naegleria lovaniensis]|uniref:Plasminogen receptor (KT) n=1 Tax=Naegleria lovaniensis TaxID=51637 RepID=A0AA88GPW2_NAELO|nr:uncharacterized protein C9374_004433 [Naegleria lovaniensis]KAG2383096.1 hypothetical protein C9374_004433 [Naegleria lovaniensis]